MKQKDLNDLPIMYSDDDRTVFDMCGENHSAFNSSTSGYVLDDSIVFGKDYPSGYVDFNIYNILTGLEFQPNLDEVFSQIKLEGNVSEDMMKDIIIGDFIKAKATYNSDDFESTVNGMNPSELSLILRNNGIIASGKKKKLVKMVLENIDPEYILATDYEITSEGEEFLNEFAWVEIYDCCLDKFKFDDFYKFVDEHEGEDFVKLALDYLDAHLKVAHKKEDFTYLMACYESKDSVHIFNEDSESALNECLKHFILRVNPVYDFEYYFESDDDFDDIVAVEECLSDVDVNLAEVFYKNWDELDLDNEIISKDNAFKFLEKLLDGQNEVELSHEFGLNHFDIKKNSPTGNGGIGELSGDSEPKVVGPAEALLLKSAILANSGQLDEALDDIDEAIEKKPYEGIFWAHKGSCLHAMNDVDGARKCFDKACELSPEHYLIWDFKGRFHYHLDEMEEALECFDVSCELKPNFVSSIVGKAKVYVDLCDWVNAEVYLDEAENIDSNDLEFLSEKIRYLLTRNDYEEAVYYCEKHLSIDDETVEVLAAMAFSLSKLGDDKRAEKYMDKVIKIDPDYMNDFDE